MNEVKMIPAAKAIEMMYALIAISEEIKGTNNGKLMVMRIENRAHRNMVTELVKVGSLVRATFLDIGDSVRLPA